MKWKSCSFVHHPGYSLKPFLILLFIMLIFCILIVLILCYCLSVISLCHQLVCPPQYLIRPFSPGCHLVQVSPLCSSAPAHMYRYSGLTPCQSSIVHDTCFTLMVSVQHHTIFFSYYVSDSMPTSCFSLLKYLCFT